MSRTNRKRIGIHRMLPVLVDSEGQVWPVTSPFFWMRPRQRDDNIVSYAVSALGFIHIWPIDGYSIVVSLRPDLVDPKTMTAAFYAMADLRPARVFISITNTTKQEWEVFNCLDRALNRIDQLVSAAWRLSIGTKLSRVWGTLRVSNIAQPLHVSRLLYLCDFARRRGEAEAVVSPPERTLGRTPPRHAKAAMVASGLAVPFLTVADASS